MNLHLIAPSGSLPNTDILVNGEAWFKQKNISVTNLECGHRQFQRFAGTDHERLKEINVAVNDNALNAYYDTLEASTSPTLFWNDYMELVEAVICELDIAVESYEQY